MATDSKMFHSTDDVRIRELRPLLPPAILMEELPCQPEMAELVTQARAEATQIIKGDNDRLLVVVGPCSIHDTEAALEYAGRLKKEADRLADDLLIVMRVYFEKPRTIAGWKGLINDPNLNNSFDINSGLRMARKLLVGINQIGLPVGGELLDPITPQFMADLLSWATIGARTTESQVHRELASGSSMPMGFKNGTTGNYQICLDALQASRCPHHFLSVTKQGITAIVSTEGNDACHMILRGGSDTGPNYDVESITAITAALENVGLPNNVMVDCSHGNSRKDHMMQPVVANYLCEQISCGSFAISGVMLESHLEEGRQALSYPSELKYGQSITDACISWEQTVPVLDSLAQAVRQRRATSKG